MIRITTLEALRPSSATSEDEFLEHDFFGLIVTDFARAEYDLTHVRQAGDRIAGDLKWTPESEEKIREAFHIANNWREAHAFPMRSIRASLRWYMYHHKIDDGVAVARLKRMQRYPQKA